MKKLKYYYLFLYCSVVFAQLPYTFTELAHYDPDNYSLQGKAYDVVVSEDSLIFTAFGGAGLYVHQFVDSHLICLTYIRDGIDHRNLLITKNASILSADNNGGIHAYRYSEHALLETASLDSDMKTCRMIQGPDSTIFMANGANGLYAYRFDGVTFNLTGSVNQSGNVRGIAMDSDGRILVANDEDDIRIYQFDGSVFLQYAHSNFQGDGGPHDVRNIELLNDSTFVAVDAGKLGVYHYADSMCSLISENELNGDTYYWNRGYAEYGHMALDEHQTLYYSSDLDGLYILKFENNELALLSERNIYEKSGGLCLSGDKLFHAQKDFGLAVYQRTDSTIQHLDHYSLADKGIRLEKGPDKTIFVAMESGGLQAISYEDEEFTLLARTAYENTVKDVSSSADGSIVSIACFHEGFRLYRYIENQFIPNNNFFLHWDNYYDWMGYSECNYYSTEITNTRYLYCAYKYFGYFVKAKALSKPSYSFNETYLRGYYHIEGNDIYPFTGLQYSGEPMDIESDDKGRVFLASSQGIREKLFGSFVNRTGSAQQIDIGENNMIYVAYGDGGLCSYEYSDHFQEKYSINSGGSAMGLKSMGENLVFLANGSDGLRAYSYEDTGFVCIAHINTQATCNDVIILDDSTIVVADDYSGLTAYSFDGWEECRLPVYQTENYLFPNYPNPFNAKTIISYHIPIMKNIQLSIYDISGRKIKQWSYLNQPAGSYKITWDGKNQTGNPIPSGVYIYRMVAGEFVESKKMVLLK